MMVCVLAIVVAALSVGSGSPAFAAALQQEPALTVRLLAPSSTTYVSGPTTLSALVTPVGDTAIARVTFIVDSATVAVVTEPPWEATWDAGEEFARHLITVQVVDVTGRQAEDTVVTRDLETAVFRSEVSAVVLNVSAVDGRGALVADLTKEDFEVFEDGKKQVITHFSPEPRPMVIGLLLDTSGSMQGAKMERARQGAVAFLGELGDEDEAFLMTFDSFPDLKQDLTGNKALLRDAINGLTVGGATSLNLAVVDGSDILVERPERRALIVLSDGYDTTQTVSVDQAVDYARRQDVRVYTIGVFESRLGGGGGSNFRRGFDTINPGENSLRSFADGTGASTILLNSLGELADAYAKIARELKSQYALAYRPSNLPKPGEWHDIEVRAKGAKEVRTKPGYFGSQY